MLPGEPIIIGAVQRVDTTFIYDRKDSKLSFAPELCIQNTVEAD
jgi:aspartyl protease family protein